MNCAREGAGYRRRDVVCFSPFLRDRLQLKHRSERVFCRLWCCSRLLPRPRPKRVAIAAGTRSQRMGTLTRSPELLVIAGRLALVVGRHGAVTSFRVKLLLESIPRRSQAHGVSAAEISTPTRQLFVQLLRLFRLRHQQTLQLQPQPQLQLRPRLQPELQPQHRRSYLSRRSRIVSTCRTTVPWWLTSATRITVLKLSISLLAQKT